MGFEKLIHKLVVLWVNARGVKGLAAAPFTTVDSEEP